MSSEGDSQGREQIRCHLPDNIIGIGNAGKTVVGHYLSQDWIIEEGVAARDGESNPEGFDAYILDTATDEQTDDEARVDAINERIRRIAEQSGRQPEIVGTEATYINPLDHAPDDLISRAGLTSEATVGRIAQQANFRAWWLENDDRMLTNGYEQGVLRRRGLSKALLHASQTGGGPVEQLPRELDGTTTIVVGIGGGTGSGMFIDLAKQIKDEGDEREVNLIATIPGLEEKDRRTANAFATLSELEYLALQERNPFTNIVLVPFGPARELQDRETFLDGVVQTIVARENTTNDFIDFLDESAPNDPPRAFAPFTVAIPQILRYDVGDIIEIADSIETYRKEKQAALDTELALYRELHDFFIDEWDGEIGRALETAQSGRRVTNDQFTLSGDEASSLRNRLDDLEAWIRDEETFGHVDNRALDTWREQLNGWIEGLRDTSGDLPDKEFKKLVVTRLPDRVESLDPVEDLYPGEEEESKLDQTFRDELRAIKLRSNLLRALKIVDEDEVKEALTAAIYPNRDGWVGGTRLGDNVNQLEREIEQHETNLGILDDLESDLLPARDHNKQAWREEVEDDIDLLVALETHGEEIRSQLQELEEKLEGAFRTINNANDPGEIPQNLLDFDFVHLNERLTAVELDPVDSDAIQRTVDRAADAYEAWYEINDGGILSSFLGDKEDAKDRYRDYIDEIDDRYVLVSPTGERDDFDHDFDCEFVANGAFDSVAGRLDEKRERHLEYVIRQFEETVAEFDAADVVEEYRAQWVGDDFRLEWPGDTADASSDLRERLTSDLDVRSADELLDELLADGTGYEDAGIAHVAFHDAYVGPVEAERDRIDADVSELRGRVDIYERLREIVMNRGENFDGIGPARPQMDDIPTTTLNSDSPYVTKTKSVDQTGLRQYADIAESGIWQKQDSDEMRKIRTHFERFAENVGRNTDIVGLSKRRIEVATGSGAGEYSDVTNPVFDGHYVGNVFMGRPFPNENPAHPIFDSVKETLDDSSLYFREGENGYSQQSVGFGAPWDLSMLTFIGGVFLDNLRPIRQPSKGYKNSYESQREELREGVRIRHVHGVDGKDDTIGEDGEGGYVYRDRLLDLDDADDLYTLLDATEEEMVDILLDEYVGKTTFPSSIDLLSE
ncbi:tubulin-like doman-containing protein [Halobellus sp. GM3]|uniref:tubulin-like doman-containing protein n=1 Tax=Halobellus sp. GM3 TaxID=3458410 RepID=UPI00403E0FB0